MKRILAFKSFILLILFMLPCALTAQGKPIADSSRDKGGRAASGAVAEIFVQLGHSARITSLVVMPDQKHFLSGSPDKSIKLWEIDTGREVRTYNITVPFDEMVISPDGAYALLTTGSELKLWDIGKAEVKKTLKGHTDKILHASIFSDGKYILSSSEDKTVKIWDSATGREMKSFDNQPAFDFSLSPDGKYVAFGKGASEGEGSTEIFEIATGKKVGAFLCTNPSCQDTKVVFSPDGKYILSASEIIKSKSKYDLFGYEHDYVLRLFDIKAGKEIKVFRGHTEFIWSVAFSTDGRYIIATDGRTLRQWDVSTGALLRNIPGIVFSLAFTPDGKNILSGSRGSRSWGIKLLDARDLKEVKTFGGDAESYESVALSPDGQRAVLGGFKVVKLLDINSGRELKAIAGHGSWVTSVLFSPDGKYVFSGGWWRYDGNPMFSSGPTHGEQYHAIKIWDVSTGALVKILTGHTRRVSSFAVSADGRYLVSGSEDNTIKLWDLPTGREIKTFTNGPLDKGRVTGVEFLSGGRQILSSGWALEGDSITRVWNVSDGTELRRYSKSVDAVSQNDRYAPSVSEERAKLCEALTAEKAKDLHGYEEFGCFSTACSHDGRHFICGSGRVDGLLKLWDVSTGQRKTFSGHSNRVPAVSFSADDRLIISVSDDHTTRIWNTATGKEVVQYVSFEDGEWIVITPDGYYNSSVNGDKHLNVRIGNNVYGVDQYREKFFRPDVVMAALAGKPITELASLTSVKPAPSVSIVETPASVGSDEAIVKVKVADQGGGIGDVRLYLNGSAVVLDRTRNLAVAAVQGEARVFSYKVRLVSGKNSLRAIAFNAGNSMQSTDALHEIDASIAAKKPSLHAVVIGIQDYENPKLMLKYPVADAKLIAATLRERASGLFESVNVVELTTKAQTTKEAITQTLKEMSGKVSPDDLFVFFVASHGTVDDGEYFLITSNVGGTSTHLLKQTALSQDDLKMLIANIPATKKLVFIDTCNAGKLGEAIQMAMLTRGMNEDTALKILSRAVGSTVLSASNSMQEALEGYKDHGLFTYVITEGLKGAADSDKDGYVKTHELVNYVDSQVPELAEMVFKHKQYPTTTLSGQGFPVVRVK